MDPNDLPLAVAGLPPLDKELLDNLVQYANDFAFTQPRHGWAIARLAQEAAVFQDGDLFLRSLAYWYLGRACNQWTQPQRLSRAIALARRGFEELNEVGWIAACDWLLNDLPWTRPDFVQAGQTLRKSLEALEQAGFDQFVPHCRLALAYAQILVQEYEEAKKNIAASETMFAASGDGLNQANCWLHQANTLRREDRFDEAFGKLAQANRIFEQENATVGLAKVAYQAGLCFLLRTDNLSEAVGQFRTAIHLFSDCGLDLWKGMCINNLGSVFLFRGDLTTAEGYYSEARKIFVLHENSSLLADNLHDFGEVNILKGKPHLSIEQFRGAVELYERLGSRLSIARGITNLGKAHAQNGRYQDALSLLERAAAQLSAINSHLRLGNCEKYIALVWTQLGQPVHAHEYLDRAIRNYELADQKALLPEAYSYRAVAFFLQGNNAEAISWLEKSLALAKSYGLRPQAVLARRLLGEILLRSGRYEEALTHLELVQAEAPNKDLALDQASSIISSATCHMLMAEHEKAQDAFEQALKLSEGTLPAIEWRVYMGLGELASRKADMVEALRSYRRGVEIFAQIQHNFWQPELAGHYLQEPSRSLDQAVLAAAVARAAEDTLFFVEQSKTMTLLGHLLNDQLMGLELRSQELNEIQTEIAGLLDKLRIPEGKPLPVRGQSEYWHLRARFGEQVQAYSALKSRLEREKAATRSASPASVGPFDISSFQELAGSFLGGTWLALDYYVANGRLVTISISPDGCTMTNTPISYRCQMAIEACQRAQNSFEPPTKSDLTVLGDLLLPQSIWESLKPDTHVLLAPHRTLHAAPWAALQPAFSSKPMISACTPTIVPSLRSLALLWQRSTLRPMQARDAGLLIGVSDFQGRYRNLPLVQNEIELLSGKIGEGGVSLFNERATWEALLALKDEQKTEEAAGLARFAWMHVASHVFSDSTTGRLSGLALWNDDIWLDSIRDLGPLPNLVTFSACNSSTSFIYEGDEHVDLPSTCLVAGANSVIGSMWRVPDQAAAEMLAEFYDRYLAGMSPAKAVTNTQRAMFERGKPVDDWGSFICTGMP